VAIAEKLSSKIDYSSIVRAILKKVPNHLTGDERLTRLGKLMDQLTDEYVEILQKRVDGFLLEMVEHEASDIDMGGTGCKGRVWLRVNGNKEAYDSCGYYSLNETDILIMSLLMGKSREHLVTKRFVDFSYKILNNNLNVRFRAQAYFEMDHLCLNMRLINTEIRPLKSLRFHENILKLFSLQHVKRGLILVTGITGSGKSTTLDAIIDANNRTSQAHITIIANPIEFVHHSEKSIVRHREIGRDVLSFKEGTIQALRQDPDIIVIGEVRDAETISTMLEVADSGHKVFSTLHTSSATEAIDRILGETPANEQTRIRERLADVLTCIVSQKLVPTLKGERVMAKEVMVATPSIKATIRNNHTEELYQLIYQGARFGMMTMEQDLARLYKAKIISLEEAINHANHKQRLEELVKLSTFRER